jgi:hypothetical protein
MAARWPVADLLGHVEVYISTLATSIECIRAEVGGDGRVACRGAVGHLGMRAAPRTPRPKGLDSELGLVSLVTPVQTAMRNCALA